MVGPTPLNRCRNPLPRSSTTEKTWVAATHLVGAPLRPPYRLAGKGFEISLGVSVKIKMSSLDFSTFFGTTKKDVYNILLGQPLRIDRSAYQKQQQQQQQQQQQ